MGERLNCPVSVLQDVTPSMCKTEAVSGDSMLSQLAKMTVIITHLIVEFAKNLPGFSRISKEDQIVLLKVGCLHFRGTLTDLC